MVNTAGALELKMTKRRSYICKYVSLFSSVLYKTHNKNSFGKD